MLTPFRAVLWAAFWNFIAAFVFGTAVAATIGKGLVHIELVNEKVLLAGLLGAITWNLITLTLGIPTSSSHALMGGYGGAAVAHAGFKTLILSGWKMPVLFIFLSPVIGMIVAMLVTIVHDMDRHGSAAEASGQWFRRLQLLSAAGYSLGHGTNDAQKGMGIITAAIVAGGLMKTYKVHYWVIICCHLAMAGGTMAGGWRIIKTMGQRITKLTPFGGFAAETAGAITLFATARFGIPVSTTHTITGAIVGVGASHRLTAVRWGVTRPHCVGLDIDDSRRRFHRSRRLPLPYPVLAIAHPTPSSSLSRPWLGDFANQMRFTPALTSRSQTRKGSWIWS